jgi:hypothetical protein
VKSGASCELRAFLLLKNNAHQGPAAVSAYLRTRYKSFELGLHSGKINIKNHMRRQLNRYQATVYEHISDAIGPATLLACAHRLCIKLIMTAYQSFQSF